MLALLSRHCPPCQTQQQEKHQNVISQRTAGPHRGHTPAEGHGQHRTPAGSQRPAQQPPSTSIAGTPTTPVLPRTEEARGSNPLTSTPNLAGQSVVGVSPAALTALRGRARAANAHGRVTTSAWERLPALIDHQSNNPGPTGPNQCRPGRLIVLGRGPAPVAHRSAG